MDDRVGKPLKQITREQRDRLGDVRLRMLVHVEGIGTTLDVEGLRLTGQVTIFIPDSVTVEMAGDVKHLLEEYGAILEVGPDELRERGMSPRKENE